MATFNDMPDVGTLGGTMQDSFGESSVTTGRLSDYQSYANEEVNADPWGYDFGSAGYSTPGAFSFGNLGGYNQPTGLPTSGGSYSGNTDKYGWGDFENSKFGKLATGILGFTPAGKALNLGRGLVSMLGKGDYLGAGGQVASAVGGLPGAVVNAGMQASRGNYGAAGSLAGGFAGGPFGSFLGGLGGQAVSGRGGMPQGQAGAPQAREGGGPNWEGIIGGLAGLYGNRGGGGGNLDGARDNNQAISQQIQSLGNMYSPNSPYAQQLRQTLERKDAAAGRRSQYGPREVQLMAALADKQASVSDSMGRLAQSNQANQIALQDRKRQQRGQNLATLGGLAKSSGLLDMFRGGSASTPPIMPNYNQAYDDSTWMGS